MAGRWRKLHNEELHELHSSSSIIRMVRSRRMGLVGHVARIGKWKVLGEKLEDQEVARLHRVSQLPAKDIWNKINSRTWTTKKSF
jgi:hypothetical protein